MSFREKMALDLLSVEVSANSPDTEPTARNAISLSSAIHGLGGMLFGATTLLFIQCLLALLNRRNEQDKAFKRSLAAYVTLIFALNAAYFSLSQERIQLEVHVNQSTFYAKVVTSYDYLQFVVGPLCGLLVMWLADALLMYRCFHFYGKKWLPMVGPIIMLVVSITSAAPMIEPFILQAILKPAPPGHTTTAFVPDPGDILAIGSSVPTLINTTFSLALNSLLTAMIVKRLRRHNQELKRVYGANVVLNAVPYTSIMAMLVESSALVVVAALLYIVLQVAFSSVNLYFIVVHSQVLSTLLLIMRVAKRNSCIAMTPISDLSTLQFDIPASTLRRSGSIATNEMTMSLSQTPAAASQPTT